MEKCGRARQATDDNIWLMRFAYWIVQATDTHWEYVIHITFPRPQWYVYTNIVCLLLPWLYQFLYIILEFYLLFVVIRISVFHLCSVGGPVLAVKTSEPAIRTLFW